MSDNSTYERYRRQTILTGFGHAGQQKLLAAKVLVVGAGGLGCPALQYLAAAGVGTIGIADHDYVSLHNLHRQVLYTVADTGLPKASCATAALQRLNPDITIRAYNEQVTVSNAFNLLQDYDIVLDGTDNFATRYLLNDACVLLNKPLVYGAVSKFEGQVAIFNCSPVSGEPSVNYRDLFPQPPAAGEVANCAETGVLGVLPGIIGTLQASETIKLISGTGTSLINKLLTYNLLDNQVSVFELSAATGTRQLLPASQAAFEKMDYNWLCEQPGQSFEIDAAGFDALRIKENVLVVDVREPGEMPAVYEFAHMQVSPGDIENHLIVTGSNTIILFCQSGRRSAAAAKRLAGKFGESKKIFSLAKGILHWKAQQ